MLKGLLTKCQVRKMTITIEREGTDIPRAGKRNIGREVEVLENLAVSIEREVLIINIGILIGEEATVISIEEGNFIIISKFLL